VGWRKNEIVMPDVRVPATDEDTHLRDEIDPDPLIEEMVGRLREGLSALDAVDEWGRPLAWRNVVRLALGPLANKLRDTEQALELAVSMLPQPAEAAVAEPAAEVAPAAEPAAEPASEPAVEPASEVGTPVHEETVQAQVKTVEVILPASQSQPETPLEGKAPEASVGAFFRRSGDQGAVPVRSLSTRELLSGGGSYNASAAQYDRFLTGLNGQGQQVRGDQHGRSGGSGFRNDL